MFFAVINMGIEEFSSYPLCKTCNNMVIGGKFIPIIAIDEWSSHIGVVCEECCVGRKDVALELFQVNYDLTGKV